jgi:short-subunit dehydrogenase
MNSPHALVVGASSGIGLSIARRLKRAGFVVTSLARRMPPADAVDEALCCDVLDADRMIESIRKLKEKHGAPKAVVYSAGCPVMGATLSVPETEARRAFDVNFWGLDRVAKAVIPEMRTHGGGIILAVLSIAGICPPPFEAYYSASKAAAAAYLRSLSLETRQDNVRLKWLAPGYVDTGFLERGNWFGMPAFQVRGSGVTPDEIAEAALSLLHGGPDFRIIGWKERCLALAERISPSLSKRWSEFKTKLI